MELWRAAGSSLPFSHTKENVSTAELPPSPLASSSGPVDPVATPTSHSFTDRGSFKVSRWLGGVMP